MSVKTLQTLLSIFLVILVFLRYWYTRSSLSAYPPGKIITAKIVEFPYTKNSRQYLKLDNSLIVITHPYPVYQLGDKVQIKGKVNDHFVVLNPLISKLNIKNDSLTLAMHFIRGRLEKSITKNLPRDNANLGEGMLWGTNSQFSPQSELALKQTGTIHLIVVSGFNITLVSSTILKIFSGLFSRRVAIVISLLCTTLFVMLTGSQPPAIRAGVMTVILLLSQYYGRPVTTLRVLILSVLIILLMWPQLIFSLSFQLSCLATFSILFSQALQSKKSANTSSAFIIFIKSEITTSIIAQLSVAPLLLNTFGTVSLISPLANLFVSWSVPYIMVSTLALTLADLTIPSIAKWLAFVPYSITAYFLQVIAIFARVPYASLNNIKIDSYLIWGVYIVLVYIIAKKNRQINCSEVEDMQKRENE